MAPKIIAMGSGKGGVGKTTVALNIGFALASLKKKVLVVDTDVSLPDLDLYTGLEKPIVTLLEVLNGTAEIQNAIYTIQMGLNILPCGSSLQTLRDANIDKLEDVISALRKREYDFIILDVAAGLSKFSILPMTYSDEVLIIVNPDPASISDAQKVKAVSGLAGINIAGVIVNKYKKSIYEDIGVKLGLPVFGIIPEDDAIIKARDARKPLISLKPKSSAAKAVMRIAEKLCDIPPKKSIFERFFR
ncbi:MAG: cell division ATPase MinD [Candidatus Methanoperedens sp.]|nr:cell division ATPase MinD [Candidatus Methanoperedens sp.]MCZ7370510.1 cell division ATPase MinD [Candidatus Methanoperedens sp.]